MLGVDTEANQHLLLKYQHQVTLKIFASFRIFLVFNMREDGFFGAEMNGWRGRMIGRAAPLEKYVRQI